MSAPHICDGCINTKCPLFTQQNLVFATMCGDKVTEQPTQMPLRGKLVSITYCGDCPHNDMCVSGKASYPYCNAPTPNRKFIENGVDARAGGIPSWCPLSDAEAHDSEVAAQAVKEFAEKVEKLKQVGKYKTPETLLFADGYNKAVDDIRAMAEGKSA